MALRRAASLSLIGTARGPGAAGGRTRQSRRPCLGAIAVAGGNSVRYFFSINLPWDKKRKAREEEELGIIRSFGKASSALDGPLDLPEDSRLVKWLDEASLVLPRDGLKKEEFQAWLTSGENEASELAKDKMGALQRSDWVLEASADEKEVRLALHYTALAHLFSELKKNKAVFTPHNPGDTVVPGMPDKVVKTIRAYIKGSPEDRLESFWHLVDESASGDGLLSAQAMEDAVYGALAPAHLTVTMVYPALPSVNKAQKKAFAKFIKWYFRDQADYPTKLRCIFAWAEKQGELATNQTISLEAYLKTQVENFAELPKVGHGAMELYSRTRAQAFAQKDDDRETFRLGILFYIFLTATDVYVSLL